MARKLRRRTLRAHLDKQMKNPRFRRAWEEVQRESKLTWELVGPGAGRVPLEPQSGWTTTRLRLPDWSL